MPIPRYLHVKNNSRLMAHCPKCRGVLAKVDIREAGKSKKSCVIALRCPHCKADVEILVECNLSGELFVSIDTKKQNNEL